MEYLKGGGPERAGATVAAYVGGNGSGKSLAMVHDTLRTLAGVEWSCCIPDHLHTQVGVFSGLREVWATTRLFNAEGEVHDLFRPLTRWQDLAMVEHADVLLDEVAGVASSRQGQSLPPQLVNLFLQLRRREIVMRYTSPNWARADVVLREVTRLVTVCRGIMGVRVEGSAWPRNRLFRWSSYDAVDWEEASMNRIKAAKPLCRSWYWRPGREAESAYRSGEQVFSMNHVDASGLCVDCGGTRSRQRCRCEDYGGAKAAGRDRAVSPVLFGVDVRQDDGPAVLGGVTA